MKRKRNYAPLLAGLVVTAVLALGVTLSLTVMFPITGCKIEGESRYTAEDLSAALNLAESKPNLFTADLESMADKLCAALPYIESAELRRQLPGTLRVTLHESKAALYVQEDEDSFFWLLTRGGKVLEYVNEVPEGTLPVTGKALAAPKPGTEAVWGENAQRYSFTPLLELLEQSELRSEITEVRLGIDPIPELMYQDRIRIIFGPYPKDTALTNEEVLQRKLASAVNIIGNERAEQRGIVDLSIFGYEVFTPDWNV